MPKSQRHYPLREQIKEIPEYARFGAVRKHDVHCGIDLHCNEYSHVFAIEEGVVERVGIFTGPAVGSPWWEETEYIGIKSVSGYIVYGELSARVEVGEKITAGQLIGYVRRVLKKDKGKPQSMLHLELYSQVIEPVEWKINEPKPEHLCDPSCLL